MVKVLGITSLVHGSMYHLKGSLHLFMNDFDNVSLQEVLDESKRIFEKFGIDIYVLQSSKKGFHLLSFDVLKWRLVQSIQSDLRLETDYPLINMRSGTMGTKPSELFYKYFLTLRIGEKLLKPSPTFLNRFIKPNKYFKSSKHYGIYQEFCDIPEMPIWYKDKLIFCKPLILIYNTKHNLSE